MNNIKYAIFKRNGNNTRTQKYTRTKTCNICGKTILTPYKNKYILREYKNNKITEISGFCGINCAKKYINKCEQK